METGKNKQWTLSWEGRLLAPLIFLLLCAQAKGFGEESCLSPTASPDRWQERMPGERWPSKDGDCAELTCQAHGAVTVQRCLVSPLPEGCMLAAASQGAPFPECCPRPLCPLRQHGHDDGKQADDQHHLQQPEPGARSTESPPSLDQDEPAAGHSLRDLLAAFSLLATATLPVKSVRVSELITDTTTTTTTTAPSEERGEEGGTDDVPHLDDVFGSLITPMPTRPTPGQRPGAPGASTKTPPLSHATPRPSRSPWGATQQPRQPGAATAADALLGVGQPPDGLGGLGGPELPPLRFPTRASPTGPARSGRRRQPSPAGAGGEPSDEDSANALIKDDDEVVNLFSLELPRPPLTFNGLF